MRYIWSDVWKMRVKLQPYFLELENLYRARGATAASGCCHRSVGSLVGVGWHLGLLDLLLQLLTPLGQVCV